ncbi:hypothetical protein glysoja_006506 [Glycine soja]|nr:hypothetical protein glysoja_006506 [Glycine soja]
MSIRTNRFKAVDRVLKDLERVEKEGKLNDLKSELNKIKEVFLKVKENEEELLDTLAVVDGYIRNKNIAKLREEEGHFCQKIWNSTLKLLPAAASSGQSSHHAQAAASSHHHVTPLPSSTTPQLHQEEDLEMIKDYYCNNLDLEERIFSSLLQFPENAVFKRMEIALWFSRYGDFNRLLGSKLTVPHGSAVLWLLFTNKDLIFISCQ